MGGFKSGDLCLYRKTKAILLEVRFFFVPTGSKYQSNDGQIGS